MNFLRNSLRTQLRPLRARRYASTGLDNILAGGPEPAVQVRSLGPNGLQLADGLEIPGPCIFLEGKVFLWNIPETNWKPEHFRIFESVVPKPGK